MSLCLRPLRIIVPLCAAVALLGPCAAQQPSPDPGQPAAEPPRPAAGRRPRPPAVKPPPRLSAQRPRIRSSPRSTASRSGLSELEVAQQSLPQQYRTMPLQAVFPALLDRIVDSKLVVEEGKKSKVTEDPAFKKRMAFVEDQVLQDFWIQREIASAGHAREVAAALRGEAEVRCRPRKRCMRATSWSSTEDEAKAI